MPYNNDKLPLMIDLLGGLSAARFWRYLANFETRMLEDEIADYPVERPVFICGAPRSGSTLLLQMIAGRQDFASHRYADYPFVMTPVFWQAVRRFWPGFIAGDKKERSHRDRIFVDAQSPEGFDEMIWMRFFENLHPVSGQAPLLQVDGLFASFYRDHVRKILYLRKGRRFVCKNNNHVSRMSALRQIFPDALFIIPVRDPVAQVGSMLRQHKMACAAQDRDPRALRYMQRCGHFEFGRDIRPATAERPVITFAQRWADTYRAVMQALPQKNVRLVSYEALCGDPRDVLKDLSVFIGAEILQDRDISLPRYYTPTLDKRDEDDIRRICGDIYVGLIESI